MIRYFQDGDLEKINRQDEQLLEGDGSGFVHPDTVVYEEDNKIMAILRPLFFDDGCMLTALVAKDCGNKGVKLLKQAKKLLSELMVDNNYVLITTQVGWKNAEQLARLLGFQPYDVLKNFYNGLDFKCWRISK